MSNALAKREDGSVVVVEVTEEEIQVAKNTVAEGATEAEFRLYLHDCQRQGVHPLDRQLHFTKRGGKYVPIASIDLLRSRADATGEYAGNSDPEFAEEGGQPSKATVSVRRVIAGQEREFTASARWSEFFPGERQGHMWKQMPFHMLGKCAEALALRKAFPRQLSGVYVREEMDRDRNQSEAPGVAPQTSQQPVSKTVTGMVEQCRRVKKGNTEWVVFDLDGHEYCTKDPVAMDLVEGSLEISQKVEVTYFLLNGKRIATDVSMIDDGSAF